MVFNTTEEVRWSFQYREGQTWQPSEGCGHYDNARAAGAAAIGYSEETNKEVRLVRIVRSFYDVDTM